MTFDDDYVDGPGQMQRAEALSRLTSNAKPTMTPAEIAALTDAEIAERIARDANGWRSGEWAGRLNKAWWFDSEGKAVRPMFIDDYRQHFDPANNPAQAMALFEGEHWPETGIIERDMDPMCDWVSVIVDSLCVSSVRKKDHAHPTCRTIAEAVLAAHYYAKEMP